MIPPDDLRGLGEGRIVAMERLINVRWCTMVTFCRSRDAVVILEGSCGVGNRVGVLCGWMH